VVFDLKNLKLFVGGELAGSAPVSGLPDVNPHYAYAYLGADVAGRHAVSKADESGRHVISGRARNPFHGDIDDLEVIGRPLSRAELRRYRSGG
jgi:hypothetical protein